MIKTFAYNDFSTYNHSQIKNEEFMLNEFKSFVEHGGNLNLGVNSSPYKIEVISFEEYIRTNFSPAFFDTLVKSNLIDSPFSFKFNKETKTIEEDPVYGLKWMTNNYETYEPQILSSIKQLCKDINNEEVNSFKSKEQSDSLYKSHQHPLFFIAKNLHYHSAPIWDILLTENKKIKLYMEDYLNDDKTVERFIENSYEIKKPDLAMVLYKHGFLKKELEKESTQLHPFISHCISKNEPDLIRKLGNDFNLKKIELEKESYSSFLRSARSPEMANALLDCGCFLKGPWKGKSASHDISLSLDEHMNSQTLEAILNYEPKNKNLVLEYHHHFFNLFFQSTSQFPVMKMLIERYQFPLEKYDMFQVGNKISKYEQNTLDVNPIKWFLEHGADPRNCHYFAKKTIQERDTGLKALRQYVKEGLIEPFSADMIYEISGQSMVKIFINYYEKVLPEQLSRYNKNGKPAWWGVKSDEFFSLIKNKIEDFNQLSTDKTSWIFDLVKEQTNKRNNLKWMNFAVQKIAKNSSNATFFGGGHDENKNNLLHHLLALKEYSKEKVNPGLIEFIFNHVEADWKNLVNEKNINDEFPLEKFIYITKKETVQPNKEIAVELKILLDNLNQDFPFEQKINDITLLDYLKNNYTEELYAGAYKNYERKIFAQDIEKSLPAKETIKSTLKI